MSSAAVEASVLQGPAGRAVVSTLGAELQSLQDRSGREYLWQAGPQWPRHAPILFPVIGRVVDDHIRVSGMDYPMGQHGFARDSRWTIRSSGAAHATLRLHDSPATRERLPHPFDLTVHYAMEEAGLSVVFTVRNTGQGPLPFQLGFHPAFRWPLSPEADPVDHQIEFGSPQDDRVRTVQQTLLLPGSRPSPVVGRTLALDHELFRESAIVFDAVAGSALTYTADDGRGVHLSWSGFPQLAIWSPPEDTDLLCIEPWLGLPETTGQRAEFATRADVSSLDPGEQQQMACQITLLQPRTDDLAGADSTHR